MSDTQEWNRWEFLKLRAQLAGIFVREHGNRIQFDNGGTDIATCTKDDTDYARAVEWLTGQGVNLPNWESWTAN